MHTFFDFEFIEMLALFSSVKYLFCVHGVGSQGQSVLIKVE